MKLTLYGAKTVRSSSGMVYRFSYYRVETAAGYGVCIKDQDEEKAVISGITTEAEQINTLLRLLLEGGVSPVAARDVVEDWLIA